jgi:hypothetical protein
MPATRRRISLTRDCRAIDRRGALSRRAFGGTAAAMLALSALRMAKAQGTQSVGAVEFIKGEAFAEGRSRRALESIGRRRQTLRRCRSAAPSD